MPTRHYLPDYEWAKLASALLVAAADPFDPDAEIKLILAENDILPECVRADLELQDRREAEMQAERAFQVELGRVTVEVQDRGTAADKRALGHLARIMSANARGLDKLTRAHAGPLTGATLTITTRE